MDGTWRPPVTDGSGQDRKVLKAAFELFRSAGYVLKNGGDEKILESRNYALPA